MTPAIPTTRLARLAALVLTLHAAGCAPGERSEPRARADSLVLAASTTATRAVARDGVTGDVVATPPRDVGVIVRPPRRVPIPGAGVGCDGSRVVGYRASPAATTCPAPAAGSRWSGRLLFDPAVTTNPDRRQVVLAPGGGAFCLYEYDGSDGSQPTLTGLPVDGWGARAASRPRDRAPQEWLEADCRAIVPLGELDDDSRATIVAEHHAAWRRRIDHVGALPILPASEGRPYAGPFGVEVALLDTSPDTEWLARFPPRGADPHGRAMGVLLADVTCPRGPTDTSSGCAQIVRSYQVIGEEAESVDRAGFVSRLAERIVEATRRRLGSKLIINLSVGGHPRYLLHDPGSDDVVRLRMAGTALMAALDYAACQGVLTIAASGNDEGRDPGARRFWEAGALYPAALASSEAWSCGSGRPLVYAASGLAWDDRDLPSQRDGSRARLAGPALNVAIADPVDDVGSSTAPTLPIYSGTSVAAAELSATAALVWAYRPHLTAAQVVSLIESTAVPLGRGSELCPSPSAGGCGTTRRISACRALQMALLQLASAEGRTDAANAAYALGCATPAAGTGESPSLPGELLAGLDATRLGLQLAPATAPAACGFGASYADTSASSDPASYCPEVFRGNGIDLATLGPQPPEDPCRFCGVQLDPLGNLVLYAELGSYSGALRTPTLRLHGASAQPTAVALGTRLDPALSGDLVAVQVPLSVDTSTLREASLVFEREGGAATESWLPVYAP